MSGDLLPVDDDGSLARAVEERLRVTASVGDLRRWLLSQRNVDAVDIADHLVKTMPPQRELRLACRRTDGSMKVRILDVEEGGEGLVLRNIHGE